MSKHWLFKPIKYFDEGSDIVAIHFILIEPTGATGPKLGLMDPQLPADARSRGTKLHKLL